MREEFGIGELAKRTGLPPSAIRYYEALGLLHPRRRDGGRRTYGPEAVARARGIQLAKAAGFTLKETSELYPSDTEETTLSERWRTLATRKLRELEAGLAAMEAMRLKLKEGIDCPCTSLDDCPLIQGPREQT